MEHFEKLFDSFYFKIFKKYPNDDVPKYLSGKGKMKCKHCTREIVDTIPKDAGTALCGGKSCNHVTVYGLWNEDCRQVIVKRKLSAWGDATIRME